MANQDRNPQNGMQGNSYIYKQGTTPQTRVAVSQKVRLLTPSYGSTATMSQIGLVSSFSPSESKSVDPVRGIGFGDQVAELVPGVTQPRTASIERAMLYLSNLWQATGYAAGVDGPVRSLKHHRWPFDIMQQMVFSNIADYDLTGTANQGFNGASGGFNGGTKAIQFPQVTGPTGLTSGSHTVLITMNEACWWTDWSSSVSADSAILMESGTVSISDVHDFSSLVGEWLNSGNDPTIGQLGSTRFGINGQTGVVGF